MVTAIVLANVKRNAVNETAQKLLEIDGIAEVYSVAGEWDLVAMIRARTNEQLADIVTDHMRKLEGIERTVTLIGFKAYSNYDLDRMFSIGFEEKWGCGRCRSLESAPDRRYNGLRLCRRSGSICLHD